MNERQVIEAIELIDGERRKAMMTLAEATDRLIWMKAENARLREVLRRINCCCGIIGLREATDKDLRSMVAVIAQHVADCDVA